MIISFYDADYDGNINYTEFLKILEPEESDSLRNFSNSQNPSHPDLSYDFECRLAKLFEKEMQIAKSVEINVAEIKNQPDYNLLNIYNTLKGSDNYISKGR